MPARRDRLQAGLPARRGVHPERSRGALRSRRRKWVSGIAGIAEIPDVPRSADQIRARDPEHLALALLGVEPEEGQPRERRLEGLAAAADLAEERAVLGQVSRHHLQDTAYQIETVVAGGQRQARLVTVLRRQARHAVCIDIRWVAEDEVVAPAGERLEEIAATE